MNKHSVTREIHLTLFGEVPAPVLGKIVPFISDGNIINECEIDGNRLFVIMGKCSELQSLKKGLGISGDLYSFDGPRAKINVYGFEVGL